MTPIEPEAAAKPPEFEDRLKPLGREFDEDHKKFEWVAKHYYDLFAYHAAQRHTFFNFFVVSLSFFSNAYSVLMTKGIDDKRYYVLATGLSIATYLLVIAFGRLDKRTEQIIEINEQPLKLIQAVFNHRYGGDGVWLTFEKADQQARTLRTFGKLLPKIFALGATLAAAGLAASLQFYFKLSDCWTLTFWIVPSIFAGFAIQHLAGR